MENELISVVIPAYNADNFIRETIDSVINQNYRPLEIIVVNDGSTDNTKNILCSLIEENHKEIDINIINLKENLGAANALNLGFGKARGNYISWLSADDTFIDKLKLELQIKIMKEKNIDWSYYNNFYIGENAQNSVLVKPNYIPHLRYLNNIFINKNNLRSMSLLFTNPIQGSSIMIKKEIIEEYGQFDPILNNADADGDLWLRYSILGPKLMAINGAPIFYREHPNQLSLKIKDMIYGSDLTRCRILHTYEEKDILIPYLRRFLPLVLIYFKNNYHLSRPFVSEFICETIINNKHKFGAIYEKYFLKKNQEIDNYIARLDLSREIFKEKVELSLKSEVFLEFLRIFDEQKI